MFNTDVAASCNPFVNFQKTAMVQNDEFDEYGADNCKKSERKRQREKQRRSDIASAFDELSSLLSQIDPEEKETVPNRPRRRKVGEVTDFDADTSGLTRLDLIGRTAEVLRKLKRENEDLRKQLEDYHIQVQNIDLKQDEPVEDKDVLVMVPTLSPAEPDQIGSRGPSYQGGYYYPQQFPIDFRPAALAPDCYSGRAAQQPMGYSHYQAHPQQNGWGNHSHLPHHPIISVPPGFSPEVRYPPSRQKTISTRLENQSVIREPETLFHPVSDPRDNRR